MKNKSFKIVFGRWSDDSRRSSVVVKNVYELQGALCYLNTDDDYRLYDVVQL